MAPTVPVAPAVAVDGSASAAVAASGSGTSVTFLIYSPYPRYSGGRENWLYHVTRVMSRFGMPVSVIAHATNRRPFYPAVDGVRLVLLGSVRYFDRFFYWINRLTLGLARLVDTLVIYPFVAARALTHDKADVLVCMNSVPEGLAAWIAGRRFYVSVRGDVPAEMRPRWLLERPMRALERRILHRAVRVLANGFDTRERLARAGIDSTVVPNGVDLARFRAPGPDDECAREMLQVAHGRPVIAVVGTMRPVKGTDEAILCAEEMKRTGRDFLMALVGKGEEGRYRRLVRGHGVDDVVAVLGETKDVPAILRHSDIFLALSGGSGMSMAVLEAMAAGIAVVAVDSPVYRQLIADDVNGLLASEPAEIASACVRLLNDAELRRRLGSTAATIVDAYGWERVAEQLMGALGAGLPVAARA